jgi:cysteine synthase/rhodanese-related sulfurtransferase
VIIKDITQLIGNTPLLEIDPSVHGLKNINLFAKLELLNPFGSVKDKTAWNMLRHDLDNIKAKSQTVIESSSGNTAKALQMILSMHKVPFKIVTNRIQVREVKQILQLIGTEIEELPGQSQCLDPTDPNDPQFIVEQIINSEPEKYFHTSQYTNMRNLEAHTVMTGEEIAKDLERVDYFFGGLGTTGSTRGTGIRLKTTNPQLKNIGIIASKGEGLPGIRNADEMYEVGLFDNKFYDTIIEVTVDESIDAMLTLIRSCGILSGPTGGASFAAVLKYFKKIDEQLDGKMNVVFIVCDRVEWYLSYLQKYRPSLFGLNQRKSGLSDMGVADIASTPEISPQIAEEWLDQVPRPLVVDMRGQLAYKSAHIHRSINIPADALEDLLNWGLPFSTDQKILFVCPVGEQSRRFAAYFNSRGFETWSLKGGFAEWRNYHQTSTHLDLSKIEKQAIPA